MNCSYMLCDKDKDKLCCEVCNERNKCNGVCDDVDTECGYKESLDDYIAEVWDFDGEFIPNT